MASIIPNDIIIQAQLTKLGRQILMTENNRFIVSSFALADPEMNYNLMSSTDVDYSLLDALTVYETFDPISIGNNFLIVKSSDAQNASINAVNQQIPNTEIQIVTQLQGTQTLSIGNWNNDELTVTFGLRNQGTTANDSYFLSSSFFVDFSDFWSKYGIYFDFIPVVPQSTIGSSNNYWYVASSDPTKPVKVGIDDAHKPLNGVSLGNFVNPINLPALTFSISLPSELIKPIYTYMVVNNQTQLSGNIKISNNDNTVIPVTNYYGNAPQYWNISTNIEVNVVF